MSAGNGAPQERKDGSRGSQILAFFTTLPGALTALATLITAIGGAFLGGTQVVSHAAPQPTVTVTKTVFSGGTGAGSGSDGSGTSSQTSAPAGGTDLSALTPVQEHTDGSLTTGAQQIGTTTYSDSVRFTCDAGFGSSVVYDVAGYRVLSATIGVPSNASNAAGATANVTFLKDGTTQLAPGVDVALDRPRQVHVLLHGASQLEIHSTCSNGSIDIALGNATVSSS